ncbi:hypothetical protein AB4Z38_07090 [Arthrobacter sp. 2RAF6]|uniref:hypothetical protein n=1 Tax=Arthrobacter sp. 2RAF6 TaxID=3233002 RepID=UPI003F9385F7
MIRAHKAALLARLRADPAMVGKVIDGLVDPNAAPVLPPYVAVTVATNHFDAERESSETPTMLEFRVTAHSVGVDTDQAGYFSEHVIGQFAGWRPVVTGWAPSAVKHYRSMPAMPDTSVNPAPQYITDVFTLTSRRAT